MSKIDKRMRAGFTQFTMCCMLYFAVGSSILSASQDSYVYFERTIQYWDFLPEINDVQHNRPKTLSFKTSEENWNNHFWDATKRVNKLKTGKEAGLIDGTFILFLRYSGKDVIVPMISSIDWYKKRQLRMNYISEFQKKIKKTLTKKNRSTGSGKSIDLVNASVAGTNVALKIKGNITVDGQVIFEDKEQVNTNMNQNKSWDLDIEQTQKFDIEGTIGDRWTIEVEQDSEADFDWENNMFLKYKGEPNDIFQKAEAGNISLNLPSTKFVSVGSGKSEGLFGLKAEYKLGPLAIQTILSREQVRKASQSMSGGETSSSTDINDYNFIKDRYFFIEEKFKNQYYPLNSQNQHIVDPSYVIGEYEVYKKVFSIEEGVVPGGIAYIDPSDETSYSESGSWKLLTQGQDYEIDALLGTIRLNSISSTEAVGIAYTIAEYDPDSLTFTPTAFITSTDINYFYDICNPETECDDTSPIEDYIEGNGVDGYQLPQMKLKLIKEGNSTTANSKTWPLMLKNIYSLGGSNIDPTGMEISIVHDKGSNQEDTHSQITGSSFLNIFKLDSENENNQYVEGGDGKIDLYGSFLNLKYGELFLPMHLPFAYDQNPRENSDGDVYDQFGNIEASNNYSGPDYWGNNSEAVKDILDTHLNDADNDFIDDSDNGPAMYYSTNQSDITSEHQFLIKVSNSSRGSSMTLGFMIVEGSELVTLNGRRLEKGIDYNIDYFSGTLNFLIPEATDPTAKIDVSYEENEFISFDQKLLTGTHLKYEFGERNFLSGGAFFYKQSISETKVDIGYEPMQNFIWNVNGKVEQDMNFLTTAVDRLPFIETSKVSKFNIEGEYAEVYPNPNPLGQAFLDDFESSKRTTAPSIMQRQWKMSSPPILGENIIPDNGNRGDFAWYNPYYDVNTKEIWPNQSTSTQANNTTTKTLWMESLFENINENRGWNGITTMMYSSDFDQSQSKYLDIWLNAEDVQDESLILHIDIGSISEDLQNSMDEEGYGILNTEDEDLYGGGMGDNILNDEEDTGLDGCFDPQEDGFGGCLLYGYTYENPPSINDINSADYIDASDPNGDNWSYSQESDDYSNINGLEGNGQAMGSRYPDTEDLDKDYSLDYVNDYFTTSIQPTNNTSSSFVTETEDVNGPTGWKLFRLPLSKFEKIGDGLIEWTDVRNMRLWIESDAVESSVNNSTLKIAKLEIVGNEWEELGEISRDSLYIGEFTIDSTFTIEVINTDENPEYSKPDGVVQETDSYSGITLKEQSLVLSFMENPDCDTDIISDCNPGGIDNDNIFAIEKNLNLLTGDKKNSFFVYENLEMYVFGGDPSSESSWSSDGDVDILFRIGRDDNFYEIRQPIYPEWDSRNHININLDKLSSNKLVIHPIENFTDSGPDSVFSVMENGCGGGLPEFIQAYYTFPEIISERNIDYSSLDSQIINLDSLIILNDLDDIKNNNENFVICGGNTIEDPNGDDYSCGDDLMCPGDDEYLGPDSGEQLDGTEGNGIYDFGEEFIDDNLDGDFDDLSDEELYDEDNELWLWKKENGYDIESVCANCTELRVKGEPAIDNLKYIVVGVVNRSDESIYGKVLIDELRMTGVKNEKGKALRIESSIDFADLLNVNVSYEKKDADFHRLQERLGAGSNSESYNLTAKLNPNLFLPSKWGIKTPMNMTYNHSISSPKFRPGSDILAGDIEEADPSIQTIDDKLTFSTSFNKSARSKNWFVKSTIDNITLNFSAIGKRRSTTTIEKEESLDLSSSAKYAYNFGKENYYHLFKWMKQLPLFGEFLSESRFYYTPDKLSANISLNENDKISKQRVGTETPTYSLKMQRDFTLNYKFTKSFQVNYTKNLSSNLDDYKDNKYDIVKNLSPGLVKNIKEKFTTTFSPDFLEWLDPKITYNPSYSWDLATQNDSLSLANINVVAPFKTTMNITPKEIVELFFTPDSKSGSSSRTRSRTRGRGSSSTKKSTKIYDFKNPVMKYFLGKLHSLFSIATKIKLTYDHSETHKLNNILASDSPDYFYRLGLSDTPSNLTYSNDAGTYSFMHKQDDKFSASTSLNITSKLQISKIEYKNNISRTTSSTSTPQLSVNSSESFLPLGMNGDDGFPFVNWNVNWSGFEKWWILENYFKTISLSHSYSSERSATENGGELVSWGYTQSLSPLFGLSMKTKGKNKWSFNFTVSHTEVINNTRTGTPTTRTYNNKINSSISHNRTGGLNIPLFFFRDFYISNDMNFDFNVSWNQDYKLIDPGNASSIDDFNEDERSYSLDLKPNVTYSFTRWVNGNFYFVYKVSENKNTGRTEERDFGFKVNIRIQG